MGVMYNMVRGITMGKIRVLFVCVYNSFRSQIAEKFLNEEYGDLFYAESAGLMTKEINSLAIQVMSEIDLDISKNSSDSVFDFYKQGRLYNHVIYGLFEGSRREVSGVSRYSEKVELGSARSRRV
jgi:hypothetical protein